jgi:autophagy-related protein 2
METILRATFSGVSVVLSFCDDEQSHFYGHKIGNTVGSQIDYLGAECNEIVVALKV